MYALSFWYSEYVDLINDSEFNDIESEMTNMINKAWAQLDKFIGKFPKFNCQINLFPYL